MFNRITGQQASTRNQNPPAATGQTGRIPAPTPAAGVLVAVPSARVAVVDNADDPEQSFKQELQRWVEQASTDGRKTRQSVAEDIFEVYEKGGSLLQPKLPVATNQTAGIQALTPAAGVLAAVPSAVVAVVDNARDQAQSFKQELKQWVEQAPPGEGECRQGAAERIFKVYQEGGKLLELFYLELTSLPNLAPLGQLQTLTLDSNNLGALAKNPEAAKAFFDGLGQLGQLQTLNLNSNNLGALAKNPEAAKAFAAGLGQLGQLRTLNLMWNDLGAFAENPEAAKVFFDGLVQLSQLQTLDLGVNSLDKFAENPTAAKAFAAGLSQLEQLQTLELYDNDLGESVDNTEAAKAFADGLGQLGQLQHLNFTHEFTCDDPVSYYWGAWSENLGESVWFRARLRKHNIETEHGAIIEKGKPWPTATESELFKKCATVTDAISAYGMLGHAYDKGELSWGDVQSKLETVCLAVARELSNTDITVCSVAREVLGNTDINNSDSLAKVRNQELAYLLGVVQYGADIGALTNTAALNIHLHIQNNQRINHAYSAIQDLQKNQQVLLGGLQSVGSVLGQHMAHTAQLQTQFRQCFQKLAENQQQLLENQKQLASESRQDNQTLKLEIERLKGKQEEIADNLHQVGLKMLNAKRIRAVGGALATGVSFLPLLGPAIVEGSKAIANALGVANARGFEEGLGNLKESLSRISGESVFQNTREDLKGWTLGETLQGYGIELPDDAITTRFAAITLGELSDGIQSGANYVADRIDSLQSDSQASPEAPAPLAGLTIALPTVLGQQLQQSTTQPHLPVLAQPANSSTSANLSAEHARRLNAINAPQPTANQAGAQQSAGALSRSTSTGSLATIDEKQDELAAAIKLFDTSDPDAVESFNRRLQKAIKAEQVQSGSTSLTTKTLPTRNSNKLRATAMDFTAHYGRPQLLKLMDAATFATIDDPEPVELQSAQEKVYDRALTDAKHHEGNYRGGQRIEAGNDQAN